MNRFLLACVGAFAAATAVCGGCDDAGGGPAPEIARRALEPDVRAGSQDTKDEPLVPLVVTFAGGIEYSDPSVDRDWELVALDGGATDLVDDAPTWHLSPLSRYRLTVGGGQYDPISIEMLTGEVRSTASREPIHMTQGLRLSHQGEAFVSALDHTRAQRIIGRPIQDPAAVQWEYAAVRVDPAAPTGLSTTRITTTTEVHDPILAPDAAYALLQTGEGLQVADLETLALLPGAAGPVEPDTVVLARAGVGVGVGRRPHTGHPVAFGWGPGGMEVLLEVEEPGSTTIGMPNPLRISGDGRRFGQLVDGRVTVWEIDPDAPPYALDWQGPARNPEFHLAADATLWFELNKAGGGPCPGPHDCELHITGKYVTNGVALLAVNQHAPGALVVIRYGTGEYQLRTYDPEGDQSTIWPGSLEIKEDHELGLVDWKTVTPAILPDAVLLEDPSRLLVVDTVTGAVRHSVTGVWTAFPRFDGSVLLREATRAPDLSIRHACPEGGTCKLLTLPTALDGDGPSHQLTSGLPFGPDRERVLKWCTVASDTVDCPLVVQEVPTTSLRRVAYFGTPKVDEADLVDQVDAPCYLYDGEGSTGLAQGVHCVY
jgi:hypothetical protein